jgi:hypothetical protein
VEGPTFFPGNYIVPTHVIRTSGHSYRPPLMFWMSSVTWS